MRSAPKLILTVLVACCLTMPGHWLAQAQDRTNADLPLEKPDYRTDSTSSVQVFDLPQSIADDAGLDGDGGGGDGGN